MPDERPTGSEAFVELVLRHLDGAAGTEDHAALQSALAEPDAQRAFIALCTDAAILTELVAAGQLADPTPLRRGRPWKLATAALLLVAATVALVWQPWRATETPAVPDAPASWRVVALSGAQYEVLAPGEVRLDAGELLVETDPGSDTTVTIHTPTGTATAHGTRFLIEHRPTKGTNGETPMRTPITRLLVMSGLVVLTNTHGSLPGHPGQLLASDKVGPPRQVAQSGNALGVDLYKRLATTTPNANVFFSPYSVQAALTMAYQGAASNTADQMAKVLHLPSDMRGGSRVLWEAARLGAAHAALKGKLVASKSGYQLTTANALWGASTYPWSKRFTRLVADGQDAPLFKADFATAPERERLRINAWAEKHTQGHIKDLLAAGTLDQETIMVLTNAVYFKGSWAVPFDAKRTTERAFHRSTEDEVQVPMMKAEERLGYARVSHGDQVLEVLELPYAGGEASMVLLMPSRAGGLPTLERSLSASAIDDWVGKLVQQKVRVLMPRFEMGTDYRLDDALKALGMTDAYSAEKADFRGFRADGAASQIRMSAVIHKAFVRVDEEGTEAAAATAVEMKYKSKSPSFTANRPFLVLIRHMETGAILFMGRVADPARRN